MSRIKKLDGQGEYDKASDLIEEINWKRVKSASTLCSVAAILGRAGRYDEEKELLLMAYDRASIGRSILYGLTENALRSQDIDGAKKYYNEYIETAPKDSKRYILQYEILQAEGKSNEELIPCLEELHEREFNEEWGYRLAELYDACGEEEKCVNICDELAIYFGEGEYVDKALALKEKYKELNAQQRQKRNMYRISKSFEEGMSAAQGAGTGKAAPDKFDTKNLQKELAASLQQLKNAEDAQTVEQTMHSVKKLVEGRDITVEVPQEQEMPAQSGPSDGLQQEADGQIGLDLSTQEGPAEEKQVSGQMRIEDILAEWEKTRASAQSALEEAERSRLASAKASALEQTQSILDQIEGKETQADAAQVPVTELPQTDESAAEEKGEKVTVRQEKARTQTAPEKIFVREEAPPVRDTQQIAAAEPQKSSNRPLKLTEEQKKQFTYFISIGGMEQQICKALEALGQSRAGVSSATGNVLIVGDKGCGKTMMASKLVKTVQKMYPRSGAKVGKINAASLNEKDIATVLGKVRGGYLILENIGQLAISKAQELSDLMDTDTGGLLVVMEGTADDIMTLMHNGTDLGSKFTIRIEIPIMTSDELVAFAQCYAEEKNASLDDMAVLALYTKISAISKANHATSLEEVKQIMDGAIQKAIRKNLSNTMRSIFSTRYDEDNHVIIVEKDFN